MPARDPALEAFPLAPVAFSGTPRRVPPDAPFNWLRQGWAVFVADPGQWVAMTVLLLIVFFALQIVPLIGSLVAALLMPILIAGLLQAAHRLGEEGRCALSDLFAGFNRNGSGLVVAGLLFMGGWLLIRLVVELVAGDGMAGFFVAFVLKLMLGMPLCIALWFAPALIHFNGVAPLTALRASFAAALKNWLATIVFTLVVLVLAFFALLPIGLGFLVLIPVLAGALYASHKDIFLG